MGREALCGSESAVSGASARRWVGSVRAGLGIVAPGVVLAVLVGLLQSWLSLDTGGVMVLVATAGVAVGFQAWWSRRRRGARARLALEDAALRLADGDAATRIAWPPGDELAPVMAAANELADRWDQTRRLQHERELVLGAVLDVAPMATLVVDRHDRVVYANRAGAGLFGLPGALAGRGLAEVAAGLDPPLDQALLDGAAEGIFVLDNRDADVVFLRRRRLTLQSTAATVILVERLTREVRRSEVAMWKKTTRVLSHELNNSLAPITSLSRSAGRLIEAGRAEDAIEALRIVEERSQHLASFLARYAELARLPPPQLQVVAWAEWLAELAELAGIRVAGAVPTRSARFDPAQLEQVVINLVKNAREAGSPGDAIEVSVADLGAAGFLLQLRDSGPGFSEAALAEAHLPFWTTKTGGSGLGLALAREVIDAHGGRMTLRNRPGGGAEVSLTLPEAG